MSEEEDNVCEVERVVGCRTYKGKKQYFIKWVGFPPEENTWENYEDMNCDRLVEEFEERKRAKEKSKTNSSKKESKTNSSKEKSKANFDKKEMTHNPPDDRNPPDDPFSEDSQEGNLAEIRKKYNLPKNRKVPNIYDSVVVKVEGIQNKGKRKIVKVRYVDESRGEIDYEIAKIGLPLHLLDFYESSN